MADFSASTAQIAALHDTLLTKIEVKRMLSASSADEAFRILNDIGWATAIHEAHNKAFEEVINKGLHDTKLIITKLSPPTLQKLFFLAFDLENAKASLAAHAKGKDYSEIRENLSDLSFYHKKTTYDILTGQKVGAEFFQKAVNLANEKLAGDLNNIENAYDILDGIFWQEIMHKAKSLKSSILLKFFENSLLAENVKTFLRREEERIRYLDISAENGFSYVLRNNIKEKLSSSDLSDLFKKGLETDCMSDIESEMTLEILHRIFWLARTNPQDVSNIALFFYTKLRNAEIIRSILVAKRNEMDNKEIRQIISIYLPYLT